MEVLVRLKVRPEVFQSGSPMSVGPAGRFRRSRCLQLARKESSGRIRKVLFLAALFLVCGAASTAHTTGYNFTTIDFPGAFSTYLTGINNSGDIVGYYTDANNTGSGFLYAGGAFTAIDFPGASETEAYGINNSGDIVGFYVRPKGGGGFLYAGGTFSKVDFPGASSTYPSGINDSGDIAGYYGYYLGTALRGLYGFLYSGGHFSMIEFTVHGVYGASSTLPYGINNSGDIVGFYKRTKAPVYPPSATSGGGFLYAGGTYSTIDFADASSTYPSGINNSGDIVGYYVGVNTSSGFLYTGGSFSTIDFPGASSTYLSGINDSGDIVGYYIDMNGYIHGFLASASPES